jgi:hypothetical protein
MGRKGDRPSASRIYGRGVRGDRDRDGAGAPGPRAGGILGALASLAHGHQLCGELPVHRHHLDQSPLSHAVGGSSDAEIDLDELRPGLFVCIDIAYNVFEREVLAHADATLVPERSRRLARRRSLVVLAMFTIAMLVALVAPRLGFGLICSALILHLRPDVPGSRA